MNLRSLFSEGPDVDVSDLAFDNRAVMPGSLFFCVPGFTRDGHDFAPDAVARGAVALVVARPLGLGVPEVLVADVREAMAHAAAAFQGDPTARLRVAGITGTNGKTTTAYLLRHLLEAGGVQTGLLGTVTSVIGGVEHPVKHTTPEAIDLQRAFVDMLAGGDSACVMEVSSHALELHRASAIHWAVAIFTNLTQDHLDFHPDMEAYFLAKRRLFEACEGPLVVNVDDPYGARLLEEFPRAIGFSLPEVALDASGSSFAFRGASVRVPLPGLFNASNAVGALLAAEALGVGFDVSVPALASAAAPPGRFQPVDGGQAFPVLVDYAHTPDSLENVLRAAREFTRGRLICVFGAGGDRDRAKRPLMGEIASRLSDVAIVTSDNPRSEDPEAIIAEIETGMTGEWERFVDRRAAIARAIELAGEDDVVVIAGKGHEQGQEFAGGRKEPFDDRTVALEALA